MVGVIVLLLISGVTPHSWATIIQNGGFESPALALGPQGYAYTTPLGSLSTTALANWTLGSSGGGSYAGVISNATWAPLPVSGTQCAFVEGTGVISQLATFAAGPYVLRFDSVMAWVGTADPVQVTVGGIPLTFGLASSITPTATWTTYTSDPFIIASPGSYNVVLSGVTGGVPPVALIDNVSVDVFVPEPSVVSLLLIGAGCVWRRRRMAELKCRTP
jgi:hypothetical protein